MLNIQESSQEPLESLQALQSDWYLGGDDSCHGDIGGVVQTGILSRSVGACGAFNSPLIHKRFNI